MPDYEQEKNTARESDLKSMKADAAPKETWFFERMGDGMIFPCEEKEAWDICNNRSEWKRRDFRLLGTSDGKTYQKIVRESRSKADVLAPRVEALEKEVERYVVMEDRYMMENIVDMDQPDEEDEENAMHKKKVLKLRGIIEKRRADLSVVKDEYRALVSEAVSKAIAAELEVAKANKAANGVKWPRQVNVLTPEANDAERTKILNLIKF